MATQVADPVVDALAERLVGALDRSTKAIALSSGLKHDASGTPISVGYTHGPGGTLIYPGVDPAVFHTVVGNRGLLGQLPATPSVYANPTFTVITGVGTDTGDEKDGVCDDAPVAGLARGCILTSVFGRYERSTPELELNRLGLLVDRADPMDLTLVGSPVDQVGLFSRGPGNPNVPGDVLRNEVSRKFWELGISLNRLLAQRLWSGNPINNTAGGGSKDMTGVDMLVTTGHVDALTGQACPAVDSDVKDFNFAGIEDSGSDIVDALTYIYYTRRDLAERTGVTPVRWVWVMRPELFYELTKVWPCAYFTYQCNMSFNDQARVNIDGRDQSQLRDDMRRGRYLLIDGERVDVVLDDGISTDTQTTNGNVPAACFASSIYLIPMSVVGGRAVTYLEYMDYANPSIQAALGGEMVLARAEGPWLTVPRQKNFCVQWQSKIEPRLIMRTPWLAGRLDNVVACPLQRTRSPFPDDPYFVGGGIESRPGPSYYQLWNQ